MAAAEFVELNVYIAHGTGDNVLPIGSTSRIFVNSLRKNGYNERYFYAPGP